MGLTLDHVIPWGRSLNEYLEMFALTLEDLQSSILDCAGGPASFNTEMTQKGYRVISCDPVYQFSADEICQRIQQTYPIVIEGVAASRENYIWQNLTSPEHLGAVRMAAMEQFLADFNLGVKQARYITAALPQLPFYSSQFDLALCSHFLFSYSDHLSQEFHLLSILELCRVALEVRIFPLVNLSSKVSPFLSPLMTQLEKQGYEVKIHSVPYEFQKGGNQMLRVVQTAKN